MDMESTHFTLPSSLLTLFNDGLCKNPEATAVRFDSDTEDVHILSYGNINADSDVIADQLISLQTVNEVICLSATPSKSTLCNIIGVLKAECAFAFLDVNAGPKFKLRFLESLGAKFMIVDEEEYNVVKEFISCTINSKIDCHVGMLLVLELSIKERRKFIYPDSPLAYCMETSGSTGRPKLVKVPHSCILFNIIDFRSRFNVTSTDIIFVASPLTFDPSVVDIFLALSQGASILMVPELLKLMTDKLVNILTCRNKVTIMQATPSFIRRIGSDVLKKTLLSNSSSLRVLSLGGEECPSKLKICSWKHHENKTQIFNVYGITEVSSWATIHRLDFDPNSSELIPLGEPLLETEIQVFDSEGMLVTESGFGHLYVGGSKRICFIGWEDCSVISKSPMRPTGDVVRVDEHGHLFYLMRLDDQIKRNGKKIPVKQIENMACSFIEVENCKLLYKEDSQSIILAVVVRKEFRNNSPILIQRLKSKFVSEVSSHSCPDQIIPLDYFPMSQHGKVDKKVLLEICMTNYNCISGNLCLSYEAICDTISNLWKVYLGDEVLINLSSNFILHGGTSFNAVRVANDVLLSLQIQHAPQLIDILLNRNLQAVCEYVHSIISNPIQQTEPLNLSNSHLLLNPISGVISLNEEMNENFGAVEIISRGMAKFNQSVIGLLATFKLTLHQVWGYDTSKCVDASPLVIKSTNVGSMIYIGSHSHHLYAICANTGQLKWSFKATDRIESSASSSTCGNYVFFGSYDQCLYCIESKTGNEKWRFKAGGIIKSSTAYDAINNCVYFGAYDHFFYSIEANTGVCMWKRNISNASIFSSACISKDPHHVYTGTLNGTLACLCPKSGNVLWRFNMDKPIFSSCRAVPSGICFGGVDGRLYCLSHSGEKIWEFLTEEPVFSSPCVALAGSVGGNIFCGSHDKHIYCLNVENGHLKWKTLLESAVYSTSYVATLKEIVIVVACCTNGTLYCLNASDGEILANYKFPGETFSSPVVNGDQIIVGCRDNFVYSLRMNIR